MDYKTGRIDTARELGIKIVSLLSMSGMSTDIVNDEVTVDSVVEHVMDVDVTCEGYVYNVQLNINRFSKAG